jgi:hypothetical protein
MNTFAKGTKKKLLFSISLLILIIAGYSYWKYLYPALPNNIRQTLFEGITYIREVRHTPRPIIIHVIIVDLTHPNIRFLVTPGKVTENGEIGARTTSQFLTEFKQKIAVNGSFFHPFSEKLWHSYPRHTGDPLYVLGLASCRGKVYSQVQNPFKTFYLTADNQASFQAPIDAVYNAISGKDLFLKQGKLQPPFINALPNKHPYPRTAFALDKTAKTLMIFVVDGKQKNYSEGVTMVELAEIVQAYGGDTALNMDGGGSSTLVMAGAAGEPILLNSPIHARFRGNERLVANHLGISVQGE